jgi:hypothetical protein
MLKRATRNILISALAALILFLATGIHDLMDHFPQLPFAASGTAAAIHLAAGSGIDPASDHCNACFFIQLLNQCLFPVPAEAAVTESYQICESVFPKPTPILALGREVSRGPPVAFS